jgi:hypothetical protein
MFDLVGNFYEIATIRLPVEKRKFDKTKSALALLMLTHRL